MGATDYILEGCMDGRTLDHALRAAFREDPTKLMAQACIDSLTGLMNRAGLIVEAQSWRETLSARRLLVSVRVQNCEAMYLYGGEAKVDNFLCEVAALLQRRVRNTDLGGHVAPGHFVFLIQDVAAAGLPAVHRRISNCLYDFSEAVMFGIKPLLSIHSEFLPAGSSPAFTEMLGPDATAQHHRLVEIPVTAT